MARSRPSRFLLFALALALLSGLLLASSVFSDLSRADRPLPSAPVAVTKRDCFWIIDSNTDKPTHGPFCFSDLWRTVGLGDVEITPRGQVYVSFPYERILDKFWGETVIEFDPVKGKKIGEIEVLFNPNQMVSKGSLLYVGAGGSRTRQQRLAVIDMESNAIIDQIALALSCEPEALAQTPSGNVYVSSCWSLASVDVTTGLIVYNPAEFRPMIYDSSLCTDGYIYLLLYGEIRVIKPHTWETVASTGKSTELVAWDGLGIQATDGKAYVSCSQTPAVIVYDVATGTIDHLSLPARFERIAGLSQDKLYLVADETDKVLVLDARSGQTLTEVLLP